MRIVIRACIVLTVAAVLFCTTACTHNLRIKNLQEYASPTRLDPAEGNPSVAMLPFQGTPQPPRLPGRRSIPDHRDERLGVALLDGSILKGLAERAPGDEEVRLVGAGQAEAEEETSPSPSSTRSCLLPASTSRAV